MSSTVILFQSSRPLRGATVVVVQWQDSAQVISILAPLAGRDGPGPQRLLGRQISILAPLAGRDTHSWYIPDKYENFNPRAPCGARLFTCFWVIITIVFQSSRPLRGATHQFESGQQLHKISILAPLAGRDAPASGNRNPTRNFNPRAPCGARRTVLLLISHGLTISILAPLAGRDADGRRRDVVGGGISILAPLAGRDDS